MRNDRRMGVDGTEERQALTGDGSLTGERKRESQGERETASRKRLQVSGCCWREPYATFSSSSFTSSLRPLRPLLRPTPPPRTSLSFTSIPRGTAFLFPMTATFYQPRDSHTSCPTTGWNSMPVVVTIHSKKLIELDPPEGTVIRRVPQERERILHGVPTRRSSLFRLFLRRWKARGTSTFFALLNEAKEGPAPPLGDLTRSAWTSLFFFASFPHPFFFNEYSSLEYSLSKSGNSLPNAINSVRRYRL